MTNYHYELLSFQKEKNSFCMNEKVGSTCKIYCEKETVIYNSKSKKNVLHVKEQHCEEFSKYVVHWREL